MRAGTAVADDEDMNGIEWVVDAYGCRSNALSDPQLLRELFERIIAALHLHPVQETQWHQFPHTGGITGLCLLSESHLTCHTFPEFESFCLNVFCCVPREAWDFQASIVALFGATSVSVQTVIRPYGHPAPREVENPFGEKRAFRESPVR